MDAGVQVLQHQLNRERRGLSRRRLRAILNPMQFAQMFPRAPGANRRRILSSKVENGVRIEFHATKGWRRQREG